MNETPALRSSMTPQWRRSPPPAWSCYLHRNRASEDPVRRFDAVIHIDETRAVVPLERIAGWGMDLTGTHPLGD